MKPLIAVATLLIVGVLQASIYRTSHYYPCGDLPAGTYSPFHKIYHSECDCIFIDAIAETECTVAEGGSSSWWLPGISAGDKSFPAARDTIHGTFPGDAERFSRAIVKIIKSIEFRISF